MISQDVEVIKNKLHFLKVYCIDVKPQRPVMNTPLFSNNYLVKLSENAKPLVNYYMSFLYSHVLLYKREMKFVPVVLLKEASANPRNREEILEKVQGE